MAIDFSEILYIFALYLKPMDMKKTKKEQVNLLGQLVTVGTKKYNRIMQDLKLWNDLNKSELK